MAHVELGEYGAVLTPTEGPELVEAAVELEGLGFSTIWLTGGPLARLDQVADVVRATERVVVATAILAIVRWSSDDVATLFTDLERSHPGRLVVGLGGAHGPDPIPTLEHYLDRLVTVPPSRRILAALGPRMFRMARERAAGAVPVLITPKRTAEARELLGPEPTLAVEQLLVLDTDPQRARATARGRIEFLASLPAYQANFRRMGFTDDEISGSAIGSWTPSSPGVHPTTSPPACRASVIRAPTTSRSASYPDPTRRRGRSGARSPKPSSPEGAHEPRPPSGWFDSAVASRTTSTRLTDRLRLEPIGLHHAEDLYRLHQDPAIAEWWDTIGTVESAERDARRRGRCLHRAAQRAVTGSDGTARDDLPTRDHPRRHPVRPLRHQGERAPRALIGDYRDRSSTTVRSTNSGGPSKISAIVARAAWSHSSRRGSFSRARAFSSLSKSTSM